MKFSVSQSFLERALSIVAKGMASNSTLPILSGIYISATAGVIELQSTDLTISVRHKLAANVEEGGQTVVSGRVLQNVVKTLADAVVNFEGGERVLTITCAKSTFRLNTIDAQDFPEFPSYSLERSIELPSVLLAQMVDKVYKVTSKDSSRPILSGVLLSVEQNTVRLVATDAYRLAVCDSHTQTSSADEAFTTIVSGTTLHDVMTLASEPGRLRVWRHDLHRPKDRGELPKLQAAPALDLQHLRHDRRRGALRRLEARLCHHAVKLLGAL